MRRAPILATAVLALLLAGCSSAPGTDSAPADSSSQSSSSAVEPASGETITGEGYSFAVPEGWGVPGDESIAAGASAFAADLDDADGFADNVNVILSPAGEITPEQVESQGVTELESAGATEVEVGDRVTIADSESAHLSALLTAGEASYRIDQFYLVNDGNTYIITFSFSDTVSDDDRTVIADSVLASWQWV